MKVDIHDDSGQQLAQSAPQQPVLSTNAFDVDHAEVLARIAQIIRENSSEAAPRPGTSACAYSSFR